MRPCKLHWCRIHMHINDSASILQQLAIIQGRDSQQGFKWGWDSQRRFHFIIQKRGRHSNEVEVKSIFWGYGLGEVEVKIICRGHDLGEVEVRNIFRGNDFDEVDLGPRKTLPFWSPFCLILSWKQNFWKIMKKSTFYFSVLGRTKPDLDFWKSDLKILNASFWKSLNHKDVMKCLWKVISFPETSF